MARRRRIVPAAMRCVSWMATVAVSIWSLSGAGSVASEASQSGRSAAFEVASVKANVSGLVGMSMRVLPGGRFTATNFPLQRLLRRAYGLQTLQVLGGPDWIGTDGFDIVATFDPDELIGWNRWEQRDHPKLMAMLRTLLAERFRLQLHIETRELEYYAMVRTRPGAPLGEGIQPSTTDCAAYYQARERRRSGAPQNTMPTGYCGFRSGSRGLLMTLLPGSVVMSIFAEQLQIFVGDLVRDETGLEGRFDIELTFVRDPALSPALPVPLLKRWYTDSSSASRQASGVYRNRFTVDPRNIPTVQAGIGRPRSIWSHSGKRQIVSRTYP